MLSPKLMLAITCISSLIGCDPNQPVATPEGLTAAQREWYLKLGRAGVGIAYEWLDADTEIQGYQQSEPFEELALQAGSCPVTTDFAGRLLQKAKTQESDFARTVLISTAREKLKIAIANAYAYPDYFGSEFGDRCIAVAISISNDIEALETRAGTR